MGRYKETLVGKKFHKLLVLQDIGVKNGNALWKCICECGKEKVASTTSLKCSRVRSCGCLIKNTFHDLTGQKFNKITLLRYIGKNKWKCHQYAAKCECGTDLLVEGNDVKSGKIHSCGCLNIQLTKARAKPERSLPYQIFSQYKNKAKGRGLEFTLSFDEFLILIKDPCHYCGELETNCKFFSDKSRFFKYNGIDRLDNNSGYTQGNVAAACFICNQAKHMLSLNEFKLWTNRIQKAKDMNIGVWKQLRDAKAAEKDEDKGGW